MLSNLNRTATVAMAAIILLSHAAMADIASDLSDFWNDLGGTTNRTPGTAFAGQSAGYYTLGNLRARSPSRSSQVFSISPPGFAAGCGGIDIFAGSLSFINQDELIQLSRAIAANAQGYAFDLALETISPVIAETMKDLRARLQELNLNNINSCETAQGLVDSALGKESLSRNKLCQRIGAVKGVFTDYSDARQECGRDPNAQTATRNALNDAEKESLPENVNLAWHVIRGERVPTSDWLKGDDSLAKLAMTLTGTLILDGDGTPQYYEPKIQDEELLNAIYTGGRYDYYECNTRTDPECLNITTASAQIVDTATTPISFRGRVSTAFDELTANIENNTTPLPRNIALINGTSIPIWRVLNVYSAYSGPILVTQRGPIIDLVASDIMLTWIESMINEVSKRARSSELRGFERIDDWIDDLELLRGLIIEQRIKNNDKFHQAIQLIERVRFIEEALSSRIANKAGAGFLATATGGTRQ